MSRALLVVFALSAFPAAATAGPIPWTFHSEFGGASGGSELLLWASQGVSWDAAEAHAWAGSGWENSAYRVGVGYAYFGQLGQNPWPPPAGVDDTYRAAFTLTDAGSGESGTVVMTGSSLYWDFGSQRVSKDFVLGGHEYHITLSEERQSETVAVIASVGVTTPEPGTLVLGALGLLPLAVRRLRPRAA